MPAPGTLDGKVAVVTGAARGLGRAVAEAYAAEGATVVVSDLDADATEAVAADIPGASSVACDVRDEGQVKDLVAAAVDQHGRIDVMVPNAGVGSPTPLLEMSYEDWRTVTSVNLDGVFLCLRHAAAAMVSTGGGSIVTMASITGTAGAVLLAHYAAAKAGVISLTQTAAIELRDHGVRVNALVPGFIGTDMVDSAKADFERMLELGDGGFDALIERKQGRYGEVTDVARLAVFLASDRSSFSTGAAFVVDGGAKASLI